jgi:hypothetical protein
MIKDHWIMCYILLSDSLIFVECIFMWISWEPFGCSLVTPSSDKYPDVLYLAEILLSDSLIFVGCIFMWISWEPFGCSLVTRSSDKYHDVLYLAENFLTCCHVIELDYRLVLEWRLYLLYTLIQCMTTLDSSLLHTHWCPQSCLHYRCLLAASNGRRSPSSGFPNCPQPQLPASHSNNSQRPESQEYSNSLQQLTGPAYRHKPHRRYRSSVVVQLLLSDGVTHFIIICTSCTENYIPLFLWFHNSCFEW